MLYEEGSKAISCRHATCRHAMGINNGQWRRIGQHRLGRVRPRGRSHYGPEVSISSSFNLTTSQISHARDYLHKEIEDDRQ